MNTINRDYRLDDVLSIIQKAKNVTIFDLMDLTKRSKATLKRDISLLKKRYPQIVTKRGVNGGVLWIDAEDKAGKEQK